MSKIPAPISIDSPGQLSNILEEIKAAVKNNLLEPVEPSVRSFASEFDLDDISTDGPWPDYFELTFKELSTGNQFKLSVETYHGAGGAWVLEE